MGVYATTAQDYYDYFGQEGIGTQGGHAVPEGLHRVVGAHEIKIYIQHPKDPGKSYLIGRAQRLSARRDFGTELVYEIGSMKPQEAVPLRYEGTLDLERYFVRIDDLKGVMEAIGIPFSLSHEGKILEHSTFGFVIDVTDKYTGKIIRRYRNCVIRSCDEEIRAGAIVGETMSLYYSECQDDSEISKGNLQGSATASAGVGVGAGATTSK